MPHDAAKQLEALAELITRYSDQHGVPLTPAQALVAARAVRQHFDLAGKGTLQALFDWVITVQAAGPYADPTGDDQQAQNCAAGICC